MHWAHRVVDRFPDGQLYIDLRGFDPTGAPVDAEEALRCILDVLLPSGGQIPAGMAARSGLLRSILAGRRVLLLLDNARDAAHVRPLLPGGGASLALVTSRHQLDGLTATAGARPLSLEKLTAAEARQLLTRRLGADRVVAEPGAVDDIIERCAGLPLALCVVAARAGAQPNHPLGAVAAELRDGLDALGGADSSTNLRSVFGCSYRTLAPAESRLFRLLGLHPGPDLAAPAAAALAGSDLQQARPQLADLTRAHLLDQPAVGRYSQHDLLRAYAADLVDAVDGPTGRSTALGRLLEHYLHTAHLGTLNIYPHRYPIELPAPVSGALRQELSDYTQAVAWFAAEHAGLLAVMDLAVREGFDTHAWQLAWALGTYLGRRGHWDDLRSVQDKGLAAAERLNDPLASAHSHHGLGVALANLKRYDDGLVQYAAAITLFSSLGIAIA